MKPEELKRVARERELEQRRIQGDPYSRNAAGVMEKGKKDKRRSRRREGKKSCRESD